MSRSSGVGTRAAAAAALLAVFCVVVRGGAPLMLAATLVAQVQCSRELLALGYAHYCRRRRRPAHFAHISGYFLLCALVYCWCGALLAVAPPCGGVARHVERHYRLVCFCLHLVGVVWFVAHLERRHRRRQFALLAYTHCVALLVVAQAALAVRAAAADDAIWFVVGVTSVAANDALAYVCGSLFGRTPLIAVSPRKTREGFVGAAIGGVLVTCLVAYAAMAGGGGSDSALYRLTTYRLLGGAVSVQAYPVLVHTFWLALFASLVAPFGGFFASGLKRACRVKDFGAAIPGHGGAMDRFDCQLLMLSFLHVYIGAFADDAAAAASERHALFARIVRMPDDQQIELLRLLRDTLT